MSPLGTNDQNFTENHTGGEIEIEKVPVHEVEIRQRDLLPVFYHFLRIQSDWSDRYLSFPICAQAVIK